MGRACGRTISTGLGKGEGQYRAATEKKLKNHGIVHRVTYDFYVIINPREKSGDAVAFASSLT